MPNRKQKNLLIEILVFAGILAIGIWIAVLLYKIKVKEANIEDLKSKAFAKDTKHAMEIDSLKFKLVQDSLKIVDLQRINQINVINQQDKQDKDERDQTIALIPTADDKQRDQLWTTYTPKN
jgi:Tfp pilus assembly major pilin PilA